MLVGERHPLVRRHAGLAHGRWLRLIWRDGGAPLLGVNGLTIICHGRSSPRAIKNAIRTARDYFDRGTTGHIREQLLGFKGGAGTATGETTGVVDT